ncbi:MAG TPA: tetratricopeptide repeat protein [Pyrinomonadaceae bacterium]|jgi:tetratricopeptide (TPR) repeat protein
MRIKSISRFIITVGALLAFTATAFAQSGSTRPRRVNPVSPAQPRSESGATTTTPPATPDTSTTPAAGVGATPRRRSNNSVASTTGTGSTNTARAYELLQQKQYAAAAREAKQIAAVNPTDSEAWKIAGFAEINLKQYEAAAADLQKALDLQRAANQEDANTVDALAQAYILTEKFTEALPLLVIATTRAGAPAPASMFYYRGLAEYQTGKAADAERSFNAAVKANPKDAASLYYLGQIAFKANRLDDAIALLNRATVNDARIASAWSLLAAAYLRRAASQTVEAKADADYLGAVRAGESLTRLRTDAEAATLFAQALIGAKQFARAATVLERVTTGDDAKGVTLYLLGVAHSRAKNFPKAIAALERAAAKSPEDVNIYRELGYAYEVSKQYARALTAYEKGASLAPADTDFKESAERVRPFAQKQ